jgi:hypothetical protein
MKRSAQTNIWFDKFFRDKNSHIVVWQTPNVLLATWIILKLAIYLTGSGRLKSGLEFISSAALFAWAYLELTKGVSNFRRLLGLIVLGGIVISHLK